MNAEANPAASNPLAIARMAAEEYQIRQQAARRMVASGDWTMGMAIDRLRPWLAVAARAGADLPELQPGLADQRVRNIDGTDRISEAEARVLLADEICEPQRWRAELIHARDQALERWTPPPGEASPSDASTADVQRLQALSRALGITAPWLPKAAAPISTSPEPAKPAGMTPNEVASLAQERFSAAGGQQKGLPL